MKISKLRKKLKALEKEHGDVEVMFQDPNSDGGPFAVSTLQSRVAEKKEFPKDWNMPKGFKFVLIEN